MKLQIKYGRLGLSSNKGLYLGLCFWGFSFNEGSPISFLPTLAINWCGLKYYFSYKSIFDGKYHTKALTKRINL